MRERRGEGGLEMSFGRSGNWIRRRERSLELRLTVDRMSLSHHRISDPSRATKEERKTHVEFPLKLRIQFNLHFRIRRPRLARQIAILRLLRKLDIDTPVRRFGGNLVRFQFVGFGFIGGEE